MSYVGFFGFRSAERNKESDFARLAPTKSALVAALSSLESEITGLSRRREAAREQLCHLIGSESGIYYEREEAEESLLSKVERELMLATRRVAELQRQRDRLQKMDAILKSLFDGDNHSANVRSGDMDRQGAASEEVVCFF
jgi:predicted RNase H-like nuclease (RuvC/YqgF family)